jgi:uncharacterized protein related to proFAR isomerase
LATKDKKKGIMTIPAISLTDGKFVILGKDSNYEPIEDEDGSPVDIMAFTEELVRRFGDAVYINDIDGMKSNNPQYSVLKKLTSIAELWVDAGVRSGDALIDIIFAGAQRPVLSTKSMGDLDDIPAALEVSDGILLCIDYEKGIIARNRELSKMTPAKVAEAAKESGVEDVIFADHSRRKKDSIKSEIISELCALGLDIYVGGNVVSKDLPTLEKLGVKGALMDMGEVLKNW